MNYFRETKPLQWPKKFGANMERRAFIAGLGTAVAMPLVAWAQQNGRIRRIGVLMPLAKDNPEAQARIAAFLEELQRLGWTDRRNLKIEYRWETGESNFHSKAATELVALSPDVIFATATPAVTALQRVTQTVPIIFVQVADPVGSGFVANLAKPGGNTTGFTNIDYEISAKWLQLLKEIAPHVRRVGVIRGPSLTSGIGQYGAIRSAAQALGVEVSALGGRNAGDVEQTITEFARTSNGGLISVANPVVVNNRSLIISLAARHRLPTIYPFRSFVTDGGLVSYGAEPIDAYRQAADYVDRILKGEKPADLPVPGATKFKLTIKPLRHWVSRCQLRSSPAPMRLLNKVRVSAFGP